MNKRYIDFVPKGKGATKAPVAKKAETPKATAAKPVVRQTARTVASATATQAAPRAAKPVAKPAVRPVARQAVRRVAKPAARTTARVAARPVARATAKPTVQADAEAMARAKMQSSRQEEIRLEEIFAEKPADKSSRKFGAIENFSDKFVSTKVDKRPLSATMAEATEAKSRKIARIPLLGKSKKAKVEETPAAKSTPEKKPNTADKMKIPERPFVNMEKVEKRPLSRNVYQPRKVVAAPKEEPQGPITIIEKPEKDSRIGLIVTIIITIILGAAAGTVAFLLLPK